MCHIMPTEEGDEGVWESATALRRPLRWALLRGSFIHTNTHCQVEAAEW